MAIENGTVSGFRATRNFQRASGELFTEGQFFEEAFSGQFTGVVILPLFAVFDVTAGAEPYEIGHATCWLSGALGGIAQQYGPSSMPRNVSVSTTICNLASSTFPVGVFYAVGASPLTITAAPCGPLPYLYWVPDPVPGGGWDGSTFGFRGDSV